MKFMKFIVSIWELFFFQWYITLRWGLYYWERYLGLCFPLPPPPLSPIYSPALLTPLLDMRLC